MDEPGRQTLRPFPTLPLVAVIALFPCLWLGYAFYWIHARHEFLSRPDVTEPRWSDWCWFDPPSPPWSLGILGERGMPYLALPPELVAEGRCLYPEARF